MARDTSTEFIFFSFDDYVKFRSIVSRILSKLTLDEAKFLCNISCGKALQRIKTM